MDTKTHGHADMSFFPKVRQTLRRHIEYRICTTRFMLKIYINNNIISVKLEIEDPNKIIL